MTLMAVANSSAAFSEGTAATLSSTDNPQTEPASAHKRTEGFYALNINGVLNANFVLVVMDDPLHPYMAEKDFSALQFSVVVPAVRRGDIELVPLFGHAGLSAQVDSARMVLTLEVLPNWYATTRLNLASSRSGKALPAAPGVLLNYGLQVTHAYQSPVSIGSSQNLSIFGSMGLLQMTSATTSGGLGGTQFSRLGTTFFRDDEDKLTSLIVGDSVTASSIGVPAIRYGGVSYQRNFGLQPGFSTLETPAIFDEARLPSTLEFFLNDKRIGSPLAVAPGPFEISGLPTVDTTGQVNVVIRDALNNERIVSIPYLRSPRLYREGLYGFSNTAGWLRPALDRYRTPFLATIQRYGLTPWLTLDAGATVSAAGDSLGAGATFPLLRNVIGDVSVAASRADARSGQQFEGGIQWLGGHSNAGIALTHASREFRLLGDTDTTQSRPRDDFRAFAAHVIGPPWGSVSASFGRLSTWGGGTRSITSVGWSKSFERFSLSVSGLHSNESANGATTFLLLVSVPLGGRGLVAASVQRQGGDLALRTDYSSEPVTDRGIWYRVGWAGTDPEQGDRRQDYYAAVDARSTVGEHGVEVDVRDNQVSWLARTSGSIGVLSDRPFWGPPISTGFALVSTGDAAGIPIYRWNLPVAVSDARGIALVADLNPYQDNLLTLKPEDVPFEYRITSTEVTAVPRSRGGVFVEFPMYRERPALLVLQLPNRQPIPAGASVTVRQTGEMAPVGLRGEAFLQSLPERADIEVRSEGHLCRVVVKRPPGDDPQPRLGPYTCDSEAGK
jgi:outer membrane usher protein